MDGQSTDAQMGCKSVEAMERPPGCQKSIRGTTASHLGCIPRTSDGFGGKLHPDDGIEVLHIPAGCTYLCQPIDVGINKPIKCGLREKWENWMVDGEGIVDGQAMEPSQQMIAEWLVEVYNNIPEEMGQNAWKKRGYEWVY